MHLPARPCIRETVTQEAAAAPSEPLLLRAGIIHFSHNPHCQAAQFLANFGERDPGAFLELPFCLEMTHACASEQSRMHHDADVGCCCSDAHCCHARSIEIGPCCTG